MSLARGVTHSRLGRRLMRIYHAEGIVSNAEDDERGLEQGLAAAFTNVGIEVVGAMALFAASTGLADPTVGA